ESRPASRTSARWSYEASFQVFGGRTKSLRTVGHVTDADIAARAQQTAHATAAGLRAGATAVTEVDIQSRSVGVDAGADGADAALRVQQRLVLPMGQAVQRGPLARLTAALAVRIQPVLRSRLLTEIGFDLPGVAVGAALAAMLVPSRRTTARRKGTQLGPLT